MKIELTKQHIEKYKVMEIEDIIKDVESRNPNVMKCDIIECSKWIMEECRK